MEKWEYTTIKIQTTGFFGGKLDTNSFESELNNLGAAGWELVSCFDTSQSQGSSREVVAVLKRRMSI